MFRFVSKVAIESLIKVDGYASGVKFNKLVFYLHKKLSESGNRAFRFRLPYRWYLYGAVVDFHPLLGYATARDPDHEMLNDLTWNPGQGRVDGPEGLLDEIVPMAIQFARKYSGREGIPQMLRDHYVDAPLDFQRDYLSWSQLTSDMAYGTLIDSPAVATLAFRNLERDYPTDLDPRLTPLFNRLVLYLDPLVGERRTADLKTLRGQVAVVEEFWRVFCLFLSLKHNSNLEPTTLTRFKERADEELLAYKRRLSAYLNDGYVLNQTGAVEPDDQTDNIGDSLTESAQAELLGG